jgi:hypothetical protein
MTALSATVGTGNIAGVATAIAVGEHEQHDRNAQDIADAHRRHQQFCNLADALDAADDHRAGEHHDHRAGDPERYPECVVDGTCNAVDLDHVADAEAGQSAEDRKSGAEPAPVGAESVLDRIHRAADVFAMIVDFAVLYRQHHFSILGGHADEGRHPHPEQRARSADCNCGRDTGNIAGADGGRQRRHQCSEWRYFACGCRSGCAAFPDHAKALSDLADRHESQPYLQVQAGTEDHDDHRQTPDDAVEGINQIE